jgi:sodium-dependent dicarboxylate transporter 2/3/5
MASADSVIDESPKTGQPVPSGAAEVTFGELLKSNIARAGLPRRKALAGAITAWLVFGVIHWLVPAPHGLSAAGKTTFAVVAWACVMWISEAMPVGVTGIGAPLLLVLTGVFKNNTQGIAAAFSGFTNQVFFLVVVAFLFAAIIQLAGLDRRLVLFMLDKTRASSVRRIVLGLFGSNFLLAFVQPAAVVRAGTLLPIVKGVNQLFDDTPEGRASRKAITILTLVYGTMITGLPILTAHLPNAINVALLKKQLGINITYFQWMLIEWPHILMFFVLQAWVLWFFRVRRARLPGGTTRIRQERAEQPPARRTDWLIVGVFVMVAVMWAFATDAQAGMLALVGLLIMFIPGLLPFRWREIESQTLWGTALLLGGALSLSFAMAKTGAATFVADKLASLVAGDPWILIVLIVMLVVQAIRLGLVSNVAVVSLISPIMIVLAGRLHLHPVAFTLSISDLDTYAFLLPTQITAAVIAYGTGAFSMTDYIKVGSVSLGIAMLWILFVMIPWYALLGIPIWNPHHPWPF